MSVRVTAAALVLAALPFAAPPAHAQEPTVRVRVLDREGPTAVTVWADGGAAAVAVDGRTVGTLAPGDALDVAARGGAVEVRGLGLRERGGRVEVSGPGVRVRAGRTERRYAGSLAAAAARGRLDLVNAAPLEPYVSSVVASEYPFAEVEGAKAQAVLARTYALRRAGAGGHFDLDDHTGSQVYRGLDAETAVSRRAAAETRGETLLWNGALAETPYSSSSGGHTADNDVVWDGAPLPYLRGVADPFDAGSPHDAWESVVGRDRLHRALSARFGGRVTGFRVVRRSRSGRVAVVALDGARRPTVSGSGFRRAVNAELGARTIPSTRFDVARDGRSYVFAGSGFGHGVGMSQYGARGQARAGRSYREILAHYFGGTTLAAGGGRYATLDRPAPLNAAPPPPGTGGVVVRERPAPGGAADRPRRRAGW